jgi:hypothetical protein
MVDDAFRSPRDADLVESIVSYWVSLDRGWRATALGLTIVAAHVLWQVA